MITITYNNFDELINTLSSLPENVESVVINGGSCEKTKQYLLDNKIKSLSEPDKGISDAFNKGFFLCGGDYVSYLNSGDILIDKTYFNEAIEILDKDPCLHFVYADLCFVDRYAGEIRTKSGHSLPSMPYLHPTLVVRKETMKKVGLFNLNYKIAMDLDFAYRLIKSGAKGKYIPRMVVKMNGDGVSSTNLFSGYLEVLKIIKSNRDYSLRSMQFILKNSILLPIKLLLVKIGGEKVLKYYRMKKYRITS